MKPACPCRIFLSAVSTSNQEPLSISGNSRVRPDRGGQIIENVLLFNCDGSRSARIAHACTTFPLGCLIGSKRNQVVARGETGLLGELTLCGGQWLFAFPELSLGDRPRPLLFSRPQGTAGMNQKDLYLA